MAGCQSCCKQHLPPTPSLSCKEFLRLHCWSRHPLEKAALQICWMHSLDVFWGDIFGTLQRENRSGGSCNSLPAAMFFPEFPLYKSTLLLFCYSGGSQIFGIRTHLKKPSLPVLGAPAFVAITVTGQQCSPTQ